MTIEELRALLARHFASYRAKHRERTAIDGPRREEELETHERFLELYDKGRLGARWNDIAFEGYVADRQIPVVPNTPEYEQLRIEHGTESAEYRRYIVQHDRSLKGGDDVQPTVAPQNVSRPVSASGTMTVKELAAAFVGYSVASGRWDESTKEERSRHFELLWECIPADSRAEEVAPSQARSVRDTLLATPTNRNKLMATRGLTLAEQIAIPGLKKMDQRTIKKYLQTYKSMFAWGLEDGHIATNPFGKVAAPARSRRQKSEKKEAFNGDQLRLVLSELVGNTKGLVSRPHHKWATLIAMYSGARLNEACQLEIDDVQKHEGIYCFSINDDGADKSVKTSASIRVVPVHSRLIELGLLEYVAGVQALGHKRLFPALVWHKKDRWGRAVGRWFNERFAVELGVKSDTLSFHSLRHTLVTALSHAGMDEPMIQSIVGHERDGVTQGYFGKGFTLAQRRDAIERFAPETYGKVASPSAHPEVPASA